VNIMKSTKLFTVAVTGLGLALALDGCGSSPSNGNPGSAGTTGSGGANTGTAGTTGSGGSSSGAGGSGVGGTTGAGGSATGTAGAGGTGVGGSNGGSGGSSAGSGGSGGSSAGSGGNAAGSGGRGGAEGGSGGRGGNGGNGGSSGGATGGATGAGGSGTGGASGFMLTSPGLADGAKFDPTMYTCQMSGGTFGSGINPELDWTGVPTNTKSFVITFIDTSIAAKNPNDTKSQHWAIWNIPWDASTGKVAQFPKGTKTLSGDLATAKQSGTYLAPCAQGLADSPNDDQYAYTIYALSTDTLPGTGLSSVMSVLTALKSVTPLGTAVLHGHAGNMGK
jgi:phosphatidylethanolamine-binding protein (PEBP) family uncharacterized protein